MYEAPPPTYPSEPPPTAVRIALPVHRVVLAWALFAINIALFAFTVLRGFSPMGSRTVDDLVILIELGAKFTPLMDINGEWWRLASAMFLHGSLIHLAFNMYALYVLGPDVERMYGTLRFAIIYLAAGLAGSVGSYAFGRIEAPSIGASGAIFGLMGALGAFSFSSRKVLGEAAKRNLRQIGGVAAINLVIGFSLPGIDNYAHIGGLIVGALGGLLLAPQLQLVQEYDQPRMLSHVSKPIRWIGVVAVALLLVGFTTFIHRQRLADPAIVRELKGFED